MDVTTAKVSVGNVPDNLGLLCRRSSSRNGNMDISEGIVPLRRLPETSNDVSLFSNPMVVGSCPEMTFPATSKTFRFDRAPIEGGIVPTILLLGMCRLESCRSRLNSEGSVHGSDAESMTPGRLMSRSRTSLPKVDGMQVDRDTPTREKLSNRVSKPSSVGSWPRTPPVALSGSCNRNFLKLVSLCSIEKSNSTLKLKPTSSSSRFDKASQP
mmetsp:Transcript_14249/g.20894  ORF Transcript_14249/g.20894 Transcript_14249/m.20894 type:complete len:212 (+) Transcript_14249:925-1560(+)